MREALDSPHIDSRTGERIALGHVRALADPALQATVPDLEFAHTVLVVGCEPLDDSPILDLRIRKGVRRRGVKLAIATARPSALDVNAKLVLRYPPGGEAAFLRELATALAGGEAAERGPRPGRAAPRRRRGHRDPVGRADRRRPPADCSRSPRSSGWPAATAPGCWRSPPAQTAAGFARPARCPTPAPATPTAPAIGYGASEIGAAAADGELTALYLFQTDPLRDLPDSATWERALHARRWSSPTPRC